MNRSTIAWLVVAACGLAAASTFAQQTQNLPGLPTRADVHVLNRDRTEAVPVSLVQAAPAEVMLMRVAAPVPVEAAPNSIQNVRTSRQLWEYRQVSVAAGADAAAALNAAGSDGWEAVGAVPSPGGATAWVLKRPR